MLDSFYNQFNHEHGLQSKALALIDPGACLSLAQLETGPRQQTGILCSQEVGEMLSYKLRPSQLPWCLTLLHPNPKQCCPSQVTEHVTGHVRLLGITGLNKTSPIPVDE